MAENFYIQGNAVISNEIKAAFKREGFASPCYDFGDDGSFFFTSNKNKLVGCCSINSVVVDIIKTHPDYQELPLPAESKFKVGDLVVYKELACQVKEVYWDGQYKYTCKVGDIVGLLECDLRPATTAT